MTENIRGLLAIHLAVLLFGLSGLFGKWLPLPALIIVLGRTFFASLALGLALGLKGRSLRVASLADFRIFILVGIILAVHWMTFFHAIQVSTVAVGLLTFSTFPVFVTFMEPYFFGERLRLFDILTAFLVLCGLVLVIPSFDFANQITQGAFWGTISGLTFAILSLINRKLVRTYGAFTITFFQNAVATLILLPFCPLGFRLLDPRSLLLLGILGVFCTALAHALFIRGLKDIRAQPAGVTAGLEPVYGIFFALVLLGEIPSPRVIIGGILILGTTVAAGLWTKKR